MARGRYELPPGYSKPVYGPRRPPSSPVGTSMPVSPRLATTLPPASTSAMQSRPFIAVVSLSSSGLPSTDIAWLRSQVNGQAVVEEINSIDNAIVSLQQRPSAAFVPKVILGEPSHEPLRLAAVRYVQSGGTLITESSQIPALLQRVSIARSDCIHPATIGGECREAESTLAPSLHAMVVEQPMS